MSTEWYMKTDAEDLGPISFEELTILVHAGALGEDDLVRPSRQATWQRAESVPGLFQSSTAAPPRSAWSDTVQSALASVDARRRGAQPRARTKERTRFGASFLRGGAPRGRGVLGIFTLFAEAVAAVVEMTLSVVTSVWRSRVARSLAVVASFAAASYVGYSAIPAAWFLSTTSALKTVETIGEEVRNLQRRATTGQEWQSFADERRRQLARIVPLLEQQADTDQGARELMYAARDCLPKMMAAPSDAIEQQAIERRFADHLVRVKRIQARDQPTGSYSNASTIGILLLDTVIVAFAIRVFLKR